MEVSLVGGARREGLAEGLAEGLQQGKAIGIQETRHAMALAMLAKGLPPADIAEITGLASTEVAQLERPS